LSNNDPKNLLVQNQINELFLCGVMADVNECVGQTALDALNNSYTVNFFGNAYPSKLALLPLGKKLK
jgi:nicotinamidase-related amidase